MNSKIDFPDHNAIEVFKKVDLDCNGSLSKDELLQAFDEMGVDASLEIDTIMNNLDINGSGALDFTELKMTLIDWESEINEELLTKVFEAHSGVILLEFFKHKFAQILPHEWAEFSKKVKSEAGKFSVSGLKEYIISQLR